MALAFKACGASVKVTARTEKTIERLRGLGLDASTCNKCVASWADYVVLAVKPWQVSEVAREVSNTAGSGGLKPLVSLVAGVSKSVLESFFKGFEVYRAMTSILAGVEGNVVAVSPPAGASRLEEVIRLLSCLGRVYVVEEGELDAWTAVVGSGPALVAEIVDAFTIAAVAAGIPWSRAREAVAGIVRAVAAFLEKSGLHPAQLRDDVMTPRGTTVEAITVLEEGAVKAWIIRAIEAAVLKAKRISGNTLNPLHNGIGAG